jgi:hypothetical protein
MFWMTRYMFFLLIMLFFVGSPMTYSMGASPVVSLSSTPFAETETWPVSFSEEGVQVKVSTAVPAAVSHALTLYEPVQNTMTFSDKIRIKGVNRYLTDVFVNNTKMTLRKDGRFFYDQPLLKIGENWVWVNLISPDFKVTAIPLRVVRLKGLDGESLLTSNYTLLANSPYVENVTKWTLKTPMTREALAEAIFAYKKDLPEQKRFPTDSKNMKVAKVADAGFMTSYPDGSFKPEQSIKMVDYVVTIARLLNLNTKNYDTLVLPYKDVVTDHWTTPYVRALYGEGLLPSGNHLQLGQTLTFQLFADLWTMIPGVKADLDILYFTKNPIMTREIMREAVSATVLHVNVLRAEIAKNRRLELFSPSEGQVVYHPEIRLRGRVFPPETIRINQVPVIPSSDGSFSITLPLDNIGTHALRLNASFATLSRRVTYTPGYADMTGHWAGHTAAKFAQLGWRFDADSTFSPRKHVTRLELATLLNQIFQPTPATGNRVFKDVADDDTGVVETVVSEGWMALHQGLFLGQQEASKAEVAIVLKRTLQLPQSETPNAVYKDVPSTHWAAAEIEALVSANILTAGGVFSPSRAITRAELLSFLAKVPVINAKLEAVMP